MKWPLGLKLKLPVPQDGSRGSWREGRPLLGRGERWEGGCGVSESSHRLVSPWRGEARDDDQWSPRARTQPWHHAGSSLVTLGLNANGRGVPPELQVLAPVVDSWNTCWRISREKVN
ncbi:hypothetical protein MHYP_G00157480 [Metynnis hypsauchen]